MADLRWPDH